MRRLSPRASAQWPSTSAQGQPPAGHRGSPLTSPPSNGALAARAWTWRPGTLLLLATLAALPACSGGAGAPAATARDAAELDIAPTDVSDDEFGPATHRLLLSAERNDQQLNLLGGVVRRQLGRAQERFDRGQAKAGEDALTGAFLLLSRGETAPSLYAGLSEPLLNGANEAARVGNAGRARALYQRLAAALPDGPQLRDVKEHLAALERWSSPTATETALETAGRRERASVQQAIVDPSGLALDRATKDVSLWVHTALESDVGERPVATPADRDEALEAYRAVRGGGTVLAGLYLRDRDAKGALEALDATELARIVPPGLRDRLQRAGEDDEPEAWIDLFRLFDGVSEAAGPENPIDRELAQAAAFGCAVRLYRTAPGSVEAAMPLAMLLTQLGMAEVASTLLAQNIDEHTSPDALSWALALVLRSVVEENDAAGLDAARRTFAHAEPLLALAEQPRFASVSPRPGRLQYVMGALEIRAGRLELAKPHVEASVHAEPTVAALNALTAIHRQHGELDEAVRAQRAVIALARSNGDVLAEGEAGELLFQLERERKNTQASADALRQALERALTAQGFDAPPETQARAERLLARIFEDYQSFHDARLASERALEASRSNLSQLSATLTDMSRRALTTDDLRTARRATQEALGAHLPAEDLLYIALWQRLLEKQRGIASNGAPEQAFAEGATLEGWPQTLSHWGAGQLDDKGLLAAANTPTERTEAQFYVAMAARASSSSETKAASQRALAEVARSPAIDLVEVMIARDLTAPTAPAPSLPQDLQRPRASKSTP